MKKYFALLAVCMSLASLAQSIQLPFPHDEWTLNDDHRNRIQSLVDQIPCSDFELYVEGHTDFKGSDEYNLALSRKRAQAVADYLVALEIDESRIELSWKGESQPIQNDTSANALQANRRVVVRVRNCPQASSDTIEDVDPFDEVLKQIAMGDNRYKVKVERDTVIVTPRGNAVFIPAYAFKKNGRPVSRGTVDIVINDIVGYGDMIRANIITRDVNGDYLQTGGMIEIRATHRGDNVQLSKKLIVGMMVPEGMEDAPVWRAVDEPEYGHQVWEAYNAPPFASSPYDPCSNVRCISDVYRNCSFWCHLRLLVTEFRWNPKRDFVGPNGQPLTSDENSECEEYKKLLVEYGVSNYNELMDTLYYKEYIEYGVDNYEDYQKALYTERVNEARQRILTGQASVEDLNYVFPIENLGIYNCDAFWNYPSSKLDDIVIRHRDMIKHVRGVYLVLPTERIVVGGVNTDRITERKLVFNNLPNDIPFEVIALRSVNGELQMFRYKADSNDGESIKLEFAPVSLEEVDATMAELNELMGGG